MIVITKKSHTVITLHSMVMASMRVSLQLVVLSILHVASTRFSCPGLGFYRDPESCTAFYRCITMDMSYHYICPLGTRYDPAVKNCNHNHLAPPCPVAEDQQQHIEYDYDADYDSAYDHLPSYVPPGPQDIIDGDSQEDKLPGNVNNGATTRPEQTTEHAQITESQPSSKPNPPQSDEDKSSVTFLVSPTSLFPCQEPGYYSEQSSCTEFYVCREVAPGVLSAEALFRCPDRYVFDVETRLCQRKTRVACDKDISHLFNAFRSAFVFQLHPSELKHFFSQDLRAPRTHIIPARAQFYPPLLWLPSRSY
jgi:hypothetical protein